MLLYFWLKTLHILGAVLFLGVGLASAWYKFRADRSGDVRVIAWAQREVVLADWLFTVPSALLLPVTGLLMVHLRYWPWDPMTQFGLFGFIVAGALWLFAVRLQIRMRNLADAALATGEELPEAFHRAHRTWFLLGIPSFALAILIVWVMVTKAVPFSDLLL